MSVYSSADLLAMLPVHVVVAFAVFARVGALMMTAPAFGDFTLSPRIRLVIALAVAAALAPAAAPSFPAALLNLDNPLALPALLIGEIAVGLFLGLIARAIAAALNVAGQIIALQMGLSLAQIFDPSQEIQGAIVGGFLAVLGTTMIFVTDLHHVLLTALRDSYFLFSPGAVMSGALPVGDMAEAMIDALSFAFSLGVRLAAPFIVFGLIFYAGAGVLNRLMPQAQVFFMLMPANLLLGLTLLMLTTGLMMTVFLSAFEERLSFFIR
ncbi:MAG TPA: flagellar biosynthetic protein FliR [Parvularculaceae bacterium]|nr:flagellar biosynthetic protein FliR [Parvularculaceae bacterium]HNS87512.1 flagellar biosynthetic protein FliR [Parvularculaceae bacterium]